MKNNIIYLVFFTLLSFGCGNFLEEKSQTEIRPSTVKDMEKLLEGDAYPKTTEGALLNYGTEIFTDDIECHQKIDDKITHMNDLRLNHRPRFLWEKGMFDVYVSGVTDNSFWTICYNRIKGCNVILDYIDGKTGDASKREHLRGEAYALRGFYYLMLTNFFGMPYNYGDPREHKAVPLKLISGVITDFDDLKKNSVAECYAQIEKDLLEGARLMFENKNGGSLKILRMSYLSAYALLSRMYLYMEDYDNSLKYANLILEEKSGLLDLKMSNEVCVYDQGTSPEILWAVPENYFPSSDRLANYEPYSYSEDFMGVYSADNDGCVDVRGDYTRTKFPGSTMTVSAVYVCQGRQIFYDENWNEVANLTWPAAIYKGTESSYLVTGGVRTAEIYLNRAEIYCRRYVDKGNSADASQALSDLNELRSHRFMEGYVDKTISDFETPNDILEFCLRERRRELCGEGNHRWFDLRRLGMPEVIHEYIDLGNRKTKHSLPAKSNRYALPIPADVILRNPSLTE